MTAAELARSSEHIVERFRRRAASTPDRVAFLIADDGAEWRPVTWSAVSERVEALAQALRSSGVQAGTRVGICAASSLEWEIVQMATWCAGGTVVGLDPNYGDALLAKTIREVNVDILVVDETSTLDRLDERSRQGPRLRILLKAQRNTGTPADAVLLSRLVERATGDKPQPVALDSSAEAVIVFSSGTGGDPKAIVYRQDQLALAIDSILDKFSDIESSSTLVCWLPLSNLFQRMINLGAMARGATTYIVGDPRTVMTHLPACKPDVFMAVPRFFMRFHAAARERLERSRVARWALSTGMAHAACLRDGRRVSADLSIRWRIADALVLRRIRDAFGGRLRYCISGSAPMPMWLLEWFDAIGIPVLEAYGASENIIPIAANTLHDRRLGSVGKPLAHQRVWLDDHGEILVQGRGVAQSSSDVAHAGTVLATGDLGRFDADGYLTLLGRRSDVFKSADGKWVAPAAVEARLAALDFVEHAVVFGEGRRVNVAIICLSETSSSSREGIAAPGSHHDPGARWKKLLAAALDDLPAHSRVAGFLLLPAASFTVVGGEVTTNLKLRRRQIETRFGAELDRLVDAAVATSARPVIVAMSPSVAKNTG